MPFTVKERTQIMAAYAMMCAIWGTTWMGIKISLRYVPPISGAGLRFAVAGLAMYAVALAARKAVPPRRLPWKSVLVFACFLFGLNYILTYLAETHIGSGLTAVLFAVLPFFVFGLSRWMLDERTGPSVWAGAALSFAGVALISVTANVNGSLWYAIAALAAALSSAYANVYAKAHSHYDPLITLPPSMLLSGLTMCAIGFLTEHPSAASAFSFASIGTVLYLAILGSGVAFFLNVWLLHRIAAGIVGLSALIIPLIAVAIGVTFGGEPFGSREIAGALLVIAGTWISLRSSQSVTP